ncbi:hypothetical protein QQF64_002877 [Cirrhinus molitorella]|uniref:Uncharacterized protein n=1 Tax=Cirrhinus molitorella TaxID=172907 RepID=A0ABR3MRH8_9TELE
MCSALGGTERRAAGPAVSSPVPEPQLHWSVPEPTGFRMRAGPHGALWPHTRETACVSCHQRTESLKCAAPVCRGRAPNAPSPSVELREAPFLPSCSRFCSKIRPADWPLCLRADEPDGGSWRDGGRANFTQNTHNGIFQRVDSYTRKKNITFEISQLFLTQMEMFLTSARSEQKGHSHANKELQPRHRHADPLSEKSISDSEKNSRAALSFASVRVRCVADRPPVVESHYTDRSGGGDAPSFTGLFSSRSICYVTNSLLLHRF